MMINKICFALILGTISSFAERKVGEISDSETQIIQKRVESRNYNYFGFGPSMQLNDDPKALSYQFSVAKLFEVHENGAIRARADLISDFENKNFLINGALGVNWYVTSSDVSPYLAFDFGFGSNFTDSHGFSLGGGLGMVFFRTAGAHFSIEPNYQVILNNEFPMAFGVKFGISY